MASASTDQIELVPLDAAVLRTESSSSLRLAPSDGSNHEPDPHDDTTPHIPGGSSSVRGAVSNFVNSIIGAGIIGLPYAVREAGIITGIALLVAIAAMTAYSARLIIRLGVAANKIDYEALCEHAFGTKGFYTIMAAMFLFAWGAMIGYLVILGDTAATVTAHWLGRDTHSVGLRRVILAAAAVFGVLPLSLFRDMSNLAKTSFLSLVAVAWIVCVVMVRSVGGAPESVLPSSEADRAMHAVNKDVFPAIGVIAFAFVCHHNSFIVFNSLKEPTVGNWAKTANWSVTISVVASCVLALFGYFQFRELTDDNLLNNYAITDELVNVTRLLYACTMVLTYPLEMFVSRHCISCIWWRLKHPPTQEAAMGSPANAASQSIREEVESASGLLTVGDSSGSYSPPPLSTAAHWGISLVLFGASLIIALLTSRLGIVLELTGGISATVLGFIMPAALFFKCTEVPVLWWRHGVSAGQSLKHTWPAIVLGLFGGIAFFCSTVLTIAKAFR